MPYVFFRFLNSAEIAQYVSGANYTFFVPVDSAFEKLGFDQLSEDVLASEDGVKLLLNHFVKGRLYDRDLKHDEVFETIGGAPVKIQRSLSGNIKKKSLGFKYINIQLKFTGNITVNHANIVQSEIFVYNLGTMFYIDQVLYPDALLASVNSLPTTKSPNRPPLNNYKFSTLPDVESVPSEITEANGTDDDLLQDDEIVTPRALPVQQYNYYYSPK